MWRPLDVTLPLGTTTQFTGVDIANNPITVSNQVSNFGWEYVWHCHLLGHEENDMMRALVLAQPPEVPTPVSAVNANPTGITLSWVDNSLTASGFRVHRATDPAFTVNAVQFDTGLTTTWTDNDPALAI